MDDEVGGTQKEHGFRCLPLLEIARLSFFHFFFLMVHPLVSEEMNAGQSRRRRHRRRPWWIFMRSGLLTQV